MAEYIEREAAIESFRKNLDGGYVLTNDAQTTHILRSIPAADVRPVVRGKWEEVDRAPIFEGMGEHSTYRCSSCRAYQFYDVFDDGTARYNFCPNCGCAMEVDK